MLIRKLRLQKGWSQEKLSELTGLSTRTIQRIERGDKPSLESLRLLSEALGVENAQLQKGTIMDTNETISLEEEEVLSSVRAHRDFYIHLIKFSAVIAVLLVINLIVSPHYLWVLWVILGWGIGVILHAVRIFAWFNLFDPEWERRQVEKKLGRKL